MRILIVDDELAVLHALKRHCESFTKSIHLCSDYDEALYLVGTSVYDLIISDYTLSSNKEKNGVEFIRKIRDKGVNTPAILVTGRTEAELKVSSALDIGIDDFLRKPYSPEELISRVKSVLRRSYKSDYNASNILHHQDIRIDINKQAAYIGKTKVQIGRTLYRLLTLFLQNPQKTFSYESLIEYLWGGDSVLSAKKLTNLRVNIGNLRKSLGKHGEHIQNVAGFGYYWE